MKKYNPQLFIIGFFMNLIRNFFLLIPGIILCIVGIWVLNCLYIGLILIIFDIIVSLIQQINIKNTIENNDDPDFNEWADAMTSSDWKNSIKEKVEEEIKKNEFQDENDKES